MFMSTRSFLLPIYLATNYTDAKPSEYRNDFPLSETTIRRWKVPAFHLRKLLIGGSFTMGAKKEQ
jgi:hypothetical protein